jgi:hypothetical protein
MRGTVLRQRRFSAAAAGTTHNDTGVTPGRIPVNARAS